MNYFKQKMFNVDHPNDRVPVGDVMSAYSHPDFLLKTYAEYVTHSNKVYSELIGMISQFADEVNYEHFTNSDFIDDWIESYLYQDETLRLKFNADTIVPTSNGYSTLGDILKGIATSVFDENSNEFTVKVDSKLPSGLPTQDGVSLSQLLSDISSNFSSSIVSLEALKASALDTITERVVVFKESINNIIDISSSSVASMVSYYTSLLSSGLSINGIIGDMITTSEAEKMINDDLVYGKTKQWNYTGANPIGPLDFSNLYSGVESVVTGVINAGMSLANKAMNWLWNATLKLGKKTVNKVVEVAVNPYDVENVKDGNSPIVEYIYDENIVGSEAGPYFYNRFSFPAEYFDNIGEFKKFCNERFIGKTFHFDNLIASSSLTYLNDDDSQIYFYDSRWENEGWTCRVPTSVKNKLKPLNYDLIVKTMFGNDLSPENVDAVQASGTKVTWNVLLSILNLLFVTGRLYLDTTVDEETLAKGFIFSHLLYSSSLSTIHGLTNVNHNPITQTPGATVNFAVTIENGTIHPSSLYDVYMDLDRLLNLVRDDLGHVTNSSFYDILTGDNRRALNKEYDQYGKPIKFLHDKYESLAVSRQLIRNHMFYLRDMIDRPFTYMFIPILNGNLDVVPSMRLKTDAENIENFNNFIINTLAFSAGIAISVFIGVKVFKSVRNNSYRLAGLQRQYENSLANGINDPFLLNDLKRAKRKKNITSMLTLGLISGSSANTSMINNFGSDSDTASSVFGLNDKIDQISNDIGF